MERELFTFIYQSKVLLLGLEQSTRVLFFIMCVVFFLVFFTVFYMIL